jgi:putative phosphoribosyl transferase
VNVRFTDRAEAGRLLAQQLGHYAGRSDAIVLALPRGGVEVGLEIASKLRLPLDVLLVRKLGVPGHEEMAFGAVAEGVRIIDQEVVDACGLSPGSIARIINEEEAELARREAAFRAGRPPLSLPGRTAILVDDGIATGSTARASVSAARRLGAARVVVAAGVAPPSTLEMLNREADEVVCLLAPRQFRAVSLFYANFPQLTDDDVRRLLAGGMEPPAVA